MSEENKKKEIKKIVIVVGAGASSDFALLNEIQFDQNYGKIKYEISDNLKYKTHHEQAGNLYNPDPRRYFLTEKKGNNYAFPSGQALINMVGNENKVASFFWKEIVEEFRKSNLEKEQIRNDATISQLHQKFCDFLLKHHEAQTSKQKLTELTYSQVLSSFSFVYKKEQAYNTALNSFCSDKIFYEFIESNLNHLYLNSSQNSNQANSPFYKIILHNCSSRYILISKLVRYYQPFSIDELLDSIKKDKIECLAPLNLDSNKLKKILPNAEEKQEKDLKNEFRKDLINAGKTLIALFLLRSEKIELFENDSYDVDSKIWYRHIRNLIISGKDDKEILGNIENLTIISFNYDRSLDYYLRTRLSKFYPNIKERVIYPYGKLAEDEWDYKKDVYGQYNKDDAYSDKDLKDYLNDIKKFGSALRVIGELDDESDKIDNKNLQEARKLQKDIQNLEEYKATASGNNDLKTLLESDIKTLKELKNSEANQEIKKEINFVLEKYEALMALNCAHKIYFFGFAFHKQNCDLLQLDKLKNSKEIFYTNYDDSEGIKRVVTKIFKENHQINFHPSSKKGVYDALIHDFRLDFE